MAIASSPKAIDLWTAGVPACPLASLPLKDPELGRLRPDPFSIFLFDDEVYRVWLAHENPKNAERYSRRRGVVDTHPLYKLFMNYLHHLY